MADNLQETYDQIPYGSEPISGTHPGHIAAIGTLLGLTPPDPSCARILELGCAHGDNILGIATMFPRSNCTGVDISPRQIERGHALATRASLSNVSLQTMSILDITPEFGTFDYIIAHGVFSWVPRQVQDKILEICASNLSSHGLCFISYNTLPGWHVRGFIREMMLFHTRTFPDPTLRAARAREVLEFMGSSLKSDTPFGALLQDELKHPRAMPDWYLAHDFMEEFNLPEYFHSFMERCGAQGLQYVGDSEVPLMFPHEFSPAVKQNITRMSTSLLAREQYTDFLRNRMFRRSILCHSDELIRSSFDSNTIRNLFVASPLAAAPAGNAEPCAFKHPNGGGLRAPNAMLAAAATHLGARWPASIHYPELAALVSASLVQVERDIVEKSLCEGVHTCFAAGLMQLSVGPSPFSTAVSEKPLASPLARAQAEEGLKVGTLQHESCSLDTSEVNILKLLDGTLSISDIAARLTKSPEEVSRTVTKFARTALLRH